MKILFTGGGTGGHFYPLIAVAEAINDIADKEHIAGLSMYYMSDTPMDRDLLFRTGLSYIEVKTGKERTYASTKNFFDKFKTLLACIIATFKVFVLYPDVVFGKGGYASFPALFAARLLRIPVVIHESDIIPGRVNEWVGDYAEKIAISYPEAAEHFKGVRNRARIALTGQPIRNVLLEIPTDDPYETLNLERGVPLIMVLGGSQGSERINETIVDILPRLLDRYQVVHQTGDANIDWIKSRAGSVLTKNPNASRYHPSGSLDQHAIAVAGKAASLIVSRAGSSIFEIAIMGVPSVLIPLSIARNDHQRENAYSYARTGAATVVEEKNLRPELLYSVIESILSDEQKRQKMIEGTKSFVKVDAAEKIARALISIALRHE
jgi:UDP-N-acetylglucosamine--N-acetylmuramyl-(pentapeptide) pyrophosphoryl-undecaprenol N-acetylglucosamine transferase